MDLSSPETSFVQYAHVYPAKIVSSPYFSRRIAPEKAPAGGRAARCAGRGEGRAGTALSRKNAVHKERTPAKRPPAAPSPAHSAGEIFVSGKNARPPNGRPLRSLPARSAGEILVSKKNARQPNDRQLPLRPARSAGEIFVSRKNARQPKGRPLRSSPRAQRGKGLFCKKNARAAKGRPCARGGEVQTRAHSSSDLISINFFASSMTLPSKLDGSGS